MDAVRVFLIERCKSCGHSVEIECDVCPHCKKQNHALTSGAIVSARAGQPSTATGGPGPSQA